MEMRRVEIDNIVKEMGDVKEICGRCIKKEEKIDWEFGDRTGQIEMCKDMSGFQLRLYHIKRLRKRSSSMIEYVRYSALKRRVLSDTLKWEPILQVNEEKCLTLSRSIKISECDLEGMHLALCNHRTCLYNEGLDRVILFSREIAPKLRKAYAHEIGVDLEPTHTPCLVIHCSSFEWAFKEDASGMSQIWNWKTTGDVKEYETEALMHFDRGGRYLVLIPGRSMDISSLKTILQSVEGFIRGNARFFSTDLVDTLFVALSRHPSEYTVEQFSVTRFGSHRARPDHEATILMTTSLLSKTVIIDEDDDSTHSDKSSLLSSTSRILIPPPQNALPTDNIKGMSVHQRQMVIDRPQREAARLARELNRPNDIDSSSEEDSCHEELKLYRSSSLMDVKNTGRERTNVVLTARQQSLIDTKPSLILVQYYLDCGVDPSVYGRTSKRAFHVYLILTMPPSGEISSMNEFMSNIQEDYRNEVPARRESAIISYFGLDHLLNGSPGDYFAVKSELESEAARTLQRMWMHNAHRIRKMNRITESMVKKGRSKSRFDAWKKNFHPDDFGFVRISEEDYTHSEWAKFENLSSGRNCSRLDDGIDEDIQWLDKIGKLEGLDKKKNAALEKSLIKSIEAEIDWKGKAFSSELKAEILKEENEELRKRERERENGRRRRISE
ncbi:hypothetical protein PRIPAC_83729 [Pristionchus pacificus]|uniref:Uncharacterized protein n=1 Tax=Pristionchus pacificus TaxID=54126 RepID=A0A2A6CCS9_PRIPA|nr:hypothetical protein PRIPAC_83729 [Pristionchus pacificus]|eukprot:PDM75929.1 hypothetical protein PRIPAC_43772 [Pristionchus pacificus]